MGLVLLVARLMLAAVFLAAGGAKLLDRRGSRAALVGFGLPGWMAMPGSTVLPVVELAIAASLVPTATAAAGAVAAMVLLLLFVAGIGANLAQGRTPDCHCFGQLHSSPAGWPTLLRNLMLAAVAGFVALAGRNEAGASAVAWASDLTTAEQVLVAGGLLLGLAAVAQSWISVNLMRQNGRLLLRIDALENSLALPGGGTAPMHVAGLPVGTTAPAFALPDLDGTEVSLDALRAEGKPVVLVFTDPSCGPCTALLPELARWEVSEGGRLTIALVSRRSAAENRAKLADHALRHVLLQANREVDDLYRAGGTPSAVLVTAEGRIASPVSTGADAIRSLLARGITGPLAAAASAGNGHHAQAPSPALGAFAPSIALPDLDGDVVRLEDLRGRSTLVVFWNPGCGYCQQMLAGLKAWEAAPPRGAPALLVVSTGALELNRAMDLRSRVILDQHFEAGRAFGASGTPSAVLVGADGRVASTVAVGAERVLSLARGEEAVSLRGQP